MSNAYKKYKELIKNIRYGDVTLGDLNTLVEMMADDDSLTNDEYSELYGEVLAIMCF